MNKLLSDFKEHVIVEAQKKTFIHNEWFVQYHLEIVEKLCYEIFGVLKEKKIEADWNIVYVLVWLHDY